MATKKTTSEKSAKAAPKAKAKAAPKTEKKVKAAKAPAGPRHPKARVDVAGGKASLAKALASGSGLVGSRRSWPVGVE